MIVKVYGLPKNLERPELRQLAAKILEPIQGGLNSRKVPVSFQFCHDQLNEAAKGPITIEISRVRRAENTDYPQIARQIGVTISNLFPGSACVAVHIGPECRPLAEWNSADIMDNYDAWRAETRPLSSSQAALATPLGQFLARTGGKDLVRIILNLDGMISYHGMHLLAVLTGEQPVPPHEQGDVSKMSERWLKWGRKQGYCP